MQSQERSCKDSWRISIKRTLGKNSDYKRFDEHLKSRRTQPLAGKFLACSVVRNHATENRVEDNVRNLRQENTSLARENLRQLSEIERFLLGLQEPEMETARIQSLWERRAKYFEQLESRCKRNVPNRCWVRRCYSTDWHAHHWSHLSLLNEISQSRAQAAWVLPIWEGPCAKQFQELSDHTKQQQENHRLLQQPVGPCAKLSTAQGVLKKKEAE